MPVLQVLLMIYISLNAVGFIFSIFMILECWFGDTIEEIEIDISLMSILGLLIFPVPVLLCLSGLFYNAKVKPFLTKPIKKIKIKSEQN